MHSLYETDGDSTKPGNRLRIGRPIGIAVVLLVMLVLSVLEPYLAFFTFPTLLLGVLVAWILHSSKSAAARSDDQDKAEIQIAKIPVKAGAMGLVFTVGTMVMFLALPQVRWFLLFSLPVGILIGFALHLWHKRHPFL